MKELIVCMMLVLAMSACQQKEEPKSHDHLPLAPLQAQDDLKIIREVTKNDPGNVNAWIKLGNLLMDSARFNEAIDAYRKALEIEPKNVDVRVDMGTCYRNSGKPDIAVKEFKKALEINPRHVNGHKNLAVVLAYDIGDKAQAIKEFEKTLQIAPNDPDAEQLKQEIQRLKSSK